MLQLEERGHNPGGVHGHYRPLKSFLRWYEAETDPEGWRNPIRFIKAPHVPEQILEPIANADVMAMVRKCRDDLTGRRDRAILFTLLDTGVRASELVHTELADFNSATGAIVIREGKGGKTRTVFAGRRTRRAIRAYLQKRGHAAGFLFLTESRTPLTYWGLRQIIRRRAEDAGIADQSLHSFRRAFALNLLRSGVDLLTIQRLLGHSDLTLLKRYAKQTDEDLQAAVAAHSVVDTLTE